MAEVAALSQRVSQLERALRFERSMLRIRWFGIALGLYQVLSYQPNPGTGPIPSDMRALALGALGLLALLNLFLIPFLRAPRDRSSVRTVGALAFGVDVTALWIIVWAFTFEEFGATWVILLLAPLEGALRYQLRGALIPLILGVVIEPVREIWRHDLYGFTTFVGSVTYRLGMMTLVGSIAGVMARDLSRERAAAEELAAREAAARGESSAFQKVILAGVSAPGLVEALDRMLEHISAELGYRAMTVLLVGDDGRLAPVAARGFPEEVRTRGLGIGEGIAGAVAASGTVEIVPDVRDDPRYVEVRPTTRSQVSVPIRDGTDIIGVLHAESDDLAAFDEADAARLERLAEQMGLVIVNARLLAQERATVERMRELDAMKSDFVAIASHELRTPLTSMHGSIKTMLREDITLSPQQTEELLEVLDRQTERLARLVEDLLVVSRLDAGGFTVRLDAVVVKDVMHEMLEQLGPAASRVRIEGEPPADPLLTDCQRIQQIARNLTENALKFSPMDTPVHLGLARSNGSLRLTVRDHGPGIPSAELPNIFERFHQVGGSLRRPAEGFGLGLYITKRLVEALGGAIEVESSIGAGTTFIVELPAKPAPREMPVRHGCLEG